MKDLNHKLAYMLGRPAPEGVDWLYLIVPSKKHFNFEARCCCSKREHDLPTDVLAGMSIDNLEELMVRMESEALAENIRLHEARDAAVLQALEAAVASKGLGLGGTIHTPFGPPIPVPPGMAREDVTKLVAEQLAKLKATEEPPTSYNPDPAVIARAMVAAARKAAGKGGDS